jgi:hypothetical protein
MPQNAFTTPPAKSSTQDGRSGSSTTGLQGTISQDQSGQTISATETLSAFRDGHSLGPVRPVQQVRKTVGNFTRVDQSNYCWGTRSLLHAELVVDYNGFENGTDVYSGRATFFGKWDTEDEGTGTPAFGTVQTDSSVFGVSLKRSFLVSYGLAQVVNGVFHATGLGLRAVVEVFFKDTKRLIRAPIVDEGPGEGINAIADLTVAASAFLQNLTEEDYSKLDNIAVDLRIIIAAPSGDAPYSSNL